MYKSLQFLHGAFYWMCVSRLSCTHAFSAHIAFFLLLLNGCTSIQSIDMNKKQSKKKSNKLHVICCHFVQFLIPFSTNYCRNIAHWNEWQNFKSKMVFDYSWMCYFSVIVAVAFYLSFPLAYVHTYIDWLALNE